MASPAVLLHDRINTLVDGWAAIAAALNVAFTVFEMPHWTAEDTRARPPTASR